MPRIPRKNITCLTRLDQNRAIFQIATKLNVLPEQVKNPIIWGNHSLIVYADIRSAIVTDYPTTGSTTKVTEALSDPEWGRKEFVEAVRDRVIKILFEIVL
jgi:malate dehydrogenase